MCNDVCFPLVTLGLCHAVIWGKTKSYCFSLCLYSGLFLGYRIRGDLYNLHTHIHMHLLFDYSFVMIIHCYQTKQIYIKGTCHLIPKTTITVRVLISLCSTY